MDERQVETGDDSGYVSTQENDVTRRHEQPEPEDDTDSRPSRKEDLGAQTSSGTPAKAQNTTARVLLPTVIAAALNSRTTNASSFTHHNSNSPSIRSVIEAHVPLSDGTSNMGHSMSRFNTTGSGFSKSHDQSVNLLAEPSISTDNERSPVTDQDDSKSADPKTSKLLFGSFDPDAYGKPNRLRDTFQGRTSRQGYSTCPTRLKEVSLPNADVTPSPSNGVLKSSTLPGSEVTPRSPAVYCPVVLPKDTSVTNSPTSGVASRRKGKRWIEENAKPGNTEVIVANTSNQQETQVQKLERLQKQEITKLGNKIRQQSSEPTTSPQALSLARQRSAKLQVAKMASDPPQIPKATTSAISSTVTAPVNGATNGRTPTNGLEAHAKAEESAKAQETAKVQKPAKASELAKTQEPRQEPKDRSMRSSTISTRGRRGGGRSYNARGGRWATTAEIKPPPAPPKSINSNAFGSEVPSDTETASGDSVAPMDNGRLLRKNRPAGPDAPLADWSRIWMPPPADWDERPRFNNNSAEFVGEFGQWNETTAAQSLNAATGVPFTRLSRDLVENPDLHPDGLNLVDPTMSVDVDTAYQYGYSGDALTTIQHDARLIDPDIFVNDWGKLDSRDADNLKFKNECCNDLVRNYNLNIAKEREQEISLRRAQKLARRQAGPMVSLPNPHTPRINIYLRPAVLSDMPQLQDIYNSYIKNSVRPAELHPISHSDMLNRWTDSTDEKLPFIVAVSKSAKINRAVGNAVEKIVGWASATDWVSRHSVERFTVELEIYVHQQHLHQGVGKCLMDKLIDSTDRGYIARKGYPFSCAPEVYHGYSAGGARDLIKLLIVVRSMDKPRNGKENDLPWIKKWLENEWNFEQQGHFLKAGVKFKKYVNETYFVRSTAYNPKEFAIPDETP